MGEDNELGAGISGDRIGVPRNLFTDPTQPAVRDAFDSACTLLDELGAEQVPVTIPELDHTLAAEFGIVGPVSEVIGTTTGGSDG